MDQFDRDSTIADFKNGVTKLMVSCRFFAGETPRTIVFLVKLSGLGVLQELDQQIPRYIFKIQRK